ncbi:MAG: DUF998 domain-containing protein [Candidatus Helarchaeota archaeon]|nr:DUF998 domain-containing protein [Candidatus Helarchaeota archaeon]
MGFKSNAYESLTNPKTVRNFAIIGAFSLAFALVVGIIIAQFDPDGYNLFENYISDLGSFKHTPFPYLWDFGQMICACSMIPAAFYLKKLFATYSGSDEDVKESSKTRLLLSYLCFIAMLTALLGMFMAGLFSEDRSGPLHLHLIASYIDFGGLALASLFFGIAITFYPSPVPRLLGSYMMILPPIACGIFFATFNKFIEWVLGFSLMVWLLPFAIILLRHLNKEIASRSNN